MRQLVEGEGGRLLGCALKLQCLYKLAGQERFLLVRDAVVAPLHQHQPRRGQLLRNPLRKRRVVLVPLYDQHG